MSEWLEFEVRSDSGAVYKMKVHRKTSVCDLKDNLYLSHDAPEPKTQQLYYKDRLVGNDEEIGSFFEASHPVLQLKAS
ncbi:hypothetical protein AAVH_03518 [Aphelenchoides avenae]|nr:hypothetical protein AAVH_03518 [Aphelenchus avenae]